MVLYVYIASQWARSDGPGRTHPNSLRLQSACLKTKLLRANYFTLFPNLTQSAGYRDVVKKLLNVFGNAVYRAVKVFLPDRPTLSR